MLKKSADELNTTKDKKNQANGENIRLTAIFKNAPTDNLWVHK